MKQGTLIGLLMGTVFVLIGCSSGQKGGLNILARSVPDEFAVVRRKPLTLPPDFSLRPPDETERASQVALTDSTAEAQSALLGVDTPTGDRQASLDQDDLALLQKAGVNQASDDIRRQIDQESTDLILADRNFVRDLFSDLIPYDPPGKVIKPEDANRAVRQRVQISSSPDDTQKATITRGADDTGFDWNSLWPF